MKSPSFLSKGLISTFKTLSSMSLQLTGFFAARKISVQVQQIETSFAFAFVEVRI